MTSSATNITRRLVDVMKSIMPTTAKRKSGHTSVCR